MTSFDFTWNNTEKPSGKVFARKRKPPKPNKTSPPSSKVPNIEVQVNTKPKFNTNNSQGEQLIKRKQRKDKKQGQTDEDRKQESVSRPPNLPHSLFSVKPQNVYVNADIKGKSVVEKVFSAGRNFGDLGIHRHLVSNLVKNKFVTLTNVQEKSIPVLMGRKNALIRSQTGSGKTLAYAVPIIDSLLNIEPRLQRSDGVQALIVVPTRELALQTHELFGKINTFQWIVVGHLCGGENRKTEKNRLRKGVHVLIGTPGRLLDHILHTTTFKTDNIRCLVLDEADRLLDMGFKKDIEKIVEEIDRAKTNAEYDPLSMLKGRNNKIDETESLREERNPKNKSRQTVLLSATLTKAIGELSNFIMTGHVYIDSLEDSPNVNPDHMVIPNTVKQEFVITYAKHRLFTLAAVLLAREKSKVFVFMATTQMVDYYFELFTRYLVNMPKNRGKLKDGVVALLEEGDEEEEVVFDGEFFKLHGNMDQSARKEVFTGFRAAKKGVLLCTDVVARGVDVPEADCIVQYTAPQSDDDYLHRVGRTGRAGKSGSALIFLTHDEQEYVTRLQEHKVFLKKREPEEFLSHLCVLMEEPDKEKAATALQKRFEAALAEDKELHKMACFAYSSWSRFYNTYPGKMRGIFNFRNVNLGHYVTSFGLTETPSDVARIVRGQAVAIQPKRLNKKLDTDGHHVEPVKPQKRKVKSVSLTTSEFASGLEPVKKKRRKKSD